MVYRAIRAFAAFSALATVTCAIVFAVSPNSAEAAHAVNTDGSGLHCCTISGCNCIFDDEFNGGAMDPTIWDVYNYQYSGYGNISGTTSCMLPSQMVVDGGYLNQTAVLGAVTCPLPDGGTGTGTYTVGYASTQSDGRPRFHSIYGTFEARIKIGGGIGPWSSFYMEGVGCDVPPYGGLYSLSTTILICGWHSPPSQEIDWNEFNYNGDNNNSTTRFNLITTSLPTGTVIRSFPVSPDPTANFHTYSGIWKPGELDLYIDGVDQGSHIVGPNVPNTPMYIILHQMMNNAPDGGGLPSTTVWDYVRVTCDANIGAPCVHN